MKIEDVRTKYAAEIASVEALAASAIGGILASTGMKSFLGGVPRLPQDFVWPERDSNPMSFLAQIDLASLPTLDGPYYLPKKGTLFFFYDCEEMPWRFEPEDRDGWKSSIARKIAVSCLFRSQKRKALSSSRSED